MRRFIFASLLTLLCVCTLSGCEQGRAPDPEIPTTPAHEKLISLLADEYEINAVTKAFENTLWIYIPLEQSFLKIAGSKDGPQKSDQRKTGITLRYFDGEQVGNNFEFKYDIGEAVSYEESNGITTEFDEIYQSVSSKLNSAIARAYGNIERKVDSHEFIERIAGDRDFAGEARDETRDRLIQSNVILTQSKVPDFIVYVIADIEKGIEFKTTAYLQDIRRMYHYQDPGFSQEFVKRVITDQIGHKIIIGDKEGAHLEYRDLTWNEFLIKQIINRVKFKFTRSSHKPQTTDPGVLHDLAIETLQAYPVRNYDKIIFHNLQNETTFSFPKTDVPPFTRYEPKDNDRNLRTIKFDAGKKL